MFLNFPCYLRKKNVFIKEPNNFYFVGIGGNGMSSIAEILFLSGYQVVGSDVVFNKRVKYLMSLGIKVYLNHSANNIKDNIDILIYSSAIELDNVEINYAITRKIIVLKRIQFLSEFLKFKYNIFVSGSHGKTTTTAIIFDLLRHCNIDISCINGGNIKSINSYAYLSNNDYFLTEVDESDAEFISLNPVFLILTNIDKDHLNNYKGNFSLLINSFVNFIKKIPFYGFLITCIDDINLKNIIYRNNFNCKIITYGFTKEADFQIVNVCMKHKKSYFSLLVYQKYHLNLIFPMLGKHNVLNCVAAIVFLFNCKGLSFKHIKYALTKFLGVSQRLEILGSFCILNRSNFLYRDITIVSDYGHHPTEILSTINTIREFYVKKRIIMLFQPHRYTRTRDCYDNFIFTFSKVDVLLLFNICSAGEKVIKNISSSNLVCSLYNIGFNNVLLVNRENVIFYLFDLIKNNDLILFQGAGKEVSLLLDNLKKKVKIV